MTSLRALPGILLIFLVSGLAPLAPTRAQDTLSISDFSVDPTGSAVIWVPFTAGSYYILYRGDEVAAIRSPADVESLPPATNPGQVELVDDRPPLAAPTRFYRVEQVPVATPKDVDADGLDDLYELARQPVLDPLDPADAFGDPDNDGRPTLQEYGDGTDPLVFDQMGLPTPTFTPPNTVTTGNSIALIGKAPGADWVRIEGGASIVTNNLSATGEFQLDVPLAPNKLNRLFITGVDTNGVVSAPRPFDILQDSQPPNLYIDFPTNGMALTASNTPVAGRVGDMLSGFRGLFVWVHSSPTDGPPPTALSQFATNSPLIAEVDVGIGPNGSYERATVPLAEGTNILTAIATDQLGNRTLRRAEVVRVPLEGDRMLLVAGDRQTGPVRRTLPKPINVRLVHADGSPYANKIVTFDVTRSDGRLRPLEADTNQLASDWTRQPNATTNGAMVLQLKTDADGAARALWTLGSDSGRGNNRVCVSAASVSGTVFFTASADGNPASQINIGSGNNQKAEVGNWTPEPLSAWVSDGLNPAAGEEVTFTVVQGGAKLLPHPDADSSVPAGVEDGSQLKVRARVTGHAQVLLQLGPLPGQNVIEASFAGNPGLPATFIAYGVSREPGRPGSFTGLVLDNTSSPVGGVFCELTVANSKLSTYSDDQGRFRFDDVPGGTGHLFVDGTTATNLAGMTIPTNSFPLLNYPVLAIANAENSLTTPVILPRRNSNNARLYDGTTNLLLTVEGIDGLEMTIQANSMTLADGRRVDSTHPVVVSLNQVHHDDIPMPMPDGVAPAFAWTLQPAGATFDPPIQIKYPNMSGLPPGSIAYFLSFNHDTERFEIVSSGHVTNDGASIVTDPGSGLTLAGWGCNCPPYSITGNCCFSEDYCVQCSQAPDTELRPASNNISPCAPCSPSDGDDNHSKAGQLGLSFWPINRLGRNVLNLPSSIAPGRIVEVRIEPANPDIAMEEIQFHIDGISPNNGSAAVTTKAYSKNGDWYLQVRGQALSEPQHGNGLRIRAIRNSDCSFAASEPFTVCAHPTDFSISIPSSLADLGCAKKVGLWSSRGLCLGVENEHKSDSVNASWWQAGPVDNWELKETFRAEVLSHSFVPNINNPFEHLMNPANRESSGYKGGGLDWADSHFVGYGAIILARVGKYIVDQAFVFACNRCGAANVPCEKSGFQIVYELSEVKKIGDSNFQTLTITKQPKSVVIEDATVFHNEVNMPIGKIATEAGIDGHASIKVNILR